MTDSYDPPLALLWNRAACNGVDLARFAPTVAARTLAMVHTAMYDAWTSYSGGTAISTTTGDRLKRPPEEHTQRNREVAFSVAAYRVLDELCTDQLPDEHQGMFKALLKNVCTQRNAAKSDPSTPEGIGNLAAKLVIDQRKGDGSNQEGGYADYTDYEPTNPPPPQRVAAISRWQPQLVDKTPQQFVTPHWGLVRPFALDCGSQFRPRAPAAVGSREWEKQLDEIVCISASLSDREKLIAEYWAGMHEGIVEADDEESKLRDGFWATPPVQYCRIARQLAAAHCFRNSNVIKTFFAVCNAFLDASIAAWDAKVSHDYCRPDSVIHEELDDETFEAWGGPCRGTVEMQGEGWCPYVPTPAFAEYPSGHSTFGRAFSEVLACLLGSDEYDDSVSFPPCSSVLEPDCTPAEEVTLSWTSLQQAADEAGMSRRYGGIHFKDGDLVGRELGQKVAQVVWRKVAFYLSGCQAG